MRPFSFPTHIQPSWPSNWPKSNGTDHPCKPGCVHVNQHALPQLVLFKLSLQALWFVFMKPQFQELSDEVHILWNAGHCEVHRQLLTDDCVCFFHCILPPSSPGNKHCRSPAMSQQSPATWQPWLVSGTWEERQLKKTRGFFFLKSELTDNSFFTPLNSAVPLPWL